MGKLLSLLLLCCLTSTAQEAHNITTNAQYFDPEALEFYTPLKKGLYLQAVMDVNTDKYYNYTILLGKVTDTINLKQYLAAKGKTESNLINLKQQKSGYTAGYGPELNGISFDYDSGTDINYSEWTLRIINPDYALMRGRWGDRDGNGHSWREFHRYAAITINNRLAFYFLKGRYQYNYTIVNTGKGYSIYTNGPDKPVLQQTSEDLTPFLRNNYPGLTVFEENDKFGLKSLDKVVVPAVYDKIDQNLSRYSIAYKGNKTYLFYANGDSIDITGIRASHDGLGGISILKGNQTFWVGSDGELLNESIYAKTTKLVDYGPDQFASHHDNPYGTFTIQAVAGNWTLSHTSENGEHLIEPDDIIASQNTFKVVTFTNNTTQSHGYPPFSGTLMLAETANGQKALLDYNTPQYTVVLGPGAYTFTYNPEDVYLFYKKEGLKGYWPLNKEARYTQLAEFDKGFARFTLPNGTQGWLAQDGKEYLDE